MRSYLISGTVNGGAAANHFTLEENSGNTTIVGSVTPRVSHGAGTLVYAISSGNTGGTFAINPATGAITVANSATLDFEMLSTHWDDPASFELFVSITDSLGMATESIRTVVTILNVNEAPVLAPLAAQAIWASLPPGSLLATASAVDPDREDYVSFSIAAGNTGNAFVIDSATGAITVAGPLDFLTTPAYTLTVRAIDHGTPVRTADCQLAISQAAPAATLDWNNGSSNGLWDTTSTSWLNGSTPAIWNNAAPDSAVFSDTAVGTITLTTGISASGMDFTTTGYSIIGNTLTLASERASPVVNVTGISTIISSVIAGTNGFTKTGAGTLTLGAMNSFTGTMKVSAGIVEINNAPEWGRGFSGANTTVEVDSGATVKFNTVWALGFTTICDDLIIHDGGALNCNGQTTYVRHMVLEGSAHISNNTQVDSNISLSGNLTATPTDATAPQLQLFRLSGSAYGVVGGTSTFTVNDNANQPVDLTVGPIFQSSTAALVKAGAGTMLMTGANSYTGSTRVNSGTLFLTGSISTGTVTVNANATLGGTGTINSTTTIADKGRLAFTLSTLAASHDPLNITGALVFSGASVLDITPSGVLPAPGTYPLVIAAAPITGSVPATLNLPTGWVATVSISADTLSLLLNVTSTGSNTYDTWSSGTFANAFTDHDPTHDPDRDGLTNLLEYAFGTDPTVSTGGEIVYDGTSVTRPGGPKFVEDGGMYYAVFGRRAGYLSAGILYTVRFSADLRAGYWTTSAIEPIALTRTGGIHAVRVPYPIELVPSGNGPQKARFFQVVVTQTP